MLKILVVEDTTEKLKNITQALEAIPNIEPDGIDNVIDFHNAAKALRNTFYDLLIVDIAIPMRVSESANSEGGIKLIKEILHRDGYIIPGYIIGLTAVDDVLKLAKKEFGSETLTVISYSETDLGWQQQLRSCIDQRIKVKSASTAISLTYQYDVAVITAVDIEFDAIYALSDSWQRISLENDATPYYETTLRGNNKSFKIIAVCASQMGMNASSVLSMKLIYNFRPKYLFMVGIAASIKDAASHGFGDVLVIDESWDGGAGKITQSEDGESHFSPTALHIRLDVDIAEKAKAYKNDKNLLRKIKDEWKYGNAPNTELSVHIGSVVSVAGVIENPAVIAKLKEKDRKLLGLEMETYGVYYAARNCGHPKPTAISFKAISDFANSDKNDTYQPYASYTSAKFMFEFLIRELQPVN